jgi:hypothetical protein
MNCPPVCWAVRYWTLPFLSITLFFTVCKGFSHLGNLAAEMLVAT